MPIFLLIFIALFVGDVLWWRWADRRLRNLPRRRIWRTLLAIFAGSQLLYLLFLGLLPVQARRAHAWMPTPPLAMVYLWHLLILPATLLVILIATTARGAFHLVWRKSKIPSPALDQPGWSRRQILAAAAVAAPPLLLSGVVGRALAEAGDFRIRRVELPLASLPPELDGLTIAQVSDIHIGRFTRGKMLPAIIDATNRLRADLVVLTGDLIDLTLSDLPAGIDLVRRLDPRQGLVMIEGNHDLIENRFEFERRVKDAGLPLLLDEATTLNIRGRPIQMLGMTWGQGSTAITAAMSRLIPLRQADTFQVLLAHHPHAFDAAAAVGIPLTLSGHTHGGQLMLTEHIGAGPMMFRYWSGLYRKLDSAMFVSNGVGNWFPLRINAPAEVVHLTLRQAHA